MANNVHSKVASCRKRCFLQEFVPSYLRICSTSKIIPFRKHLILSSSISSNFRSIIHGAWRNSRCFTASFTMRIHFTVWADCVKESEIAGFTILITLISLFVSLDQRNQSSSRTILWTESFITAIFWLLNIYLTGRTQGKHILTDRMTSCTNLLLLSLLLRPNHLFGK